MIAPENISSEGWDWYEENQIDWDYIDHLHFVGVKECWNSEEMEDPRCYSEYYLHTNEEIFDILEERSEWFGHFYYDLDSQYYDECEAGWYDPPEGLTWEEEHSLYLEELDEGCDFESSLDSWMQPMICDLKHLQGELLKHKRYQKKRKHKKDDTRHHEKYKNAFGKWHHIRRGYRVVHRGSFKHLRAERVYTEDEYFDEGGYYLYGSEVPLCDGYCTEGVCMSCDWNMEMYDLDWCDDCFIEYWDYAEVWLARKWS